MNEDNVSVAIVIMIAVLIVWVTAFCIYERVVENKCAEKGWRDSKITITLTPYCINRTDQTDIIKPLREITP